MPLESDWTDEAEEDARLRRQTLRAEPTALQFVSAEEAAKWPEGVPVLIASRYLSGRVSYYYTGWHPSYAGKQSMATHFARLPDALPELSKDG